MEVFTTTRERRERRERRGRDSSRGRRASTRQKMTLRITLHDITMAPCITSRFAKAASAMADPHARARAAADAAGLGGPVTQLGAAATMDGGGAAAAAAGGAIGHAVGSDPARRVARAFVGYIAVAFDRRWGEQCPSLSGVILVVVETNTGANRDTPHPDATRRPRFARQHVPLDSQGRPARQARRGAARRQGARATRVHQPEEVLQGWQ